MVNDRARPVPCYGALALFSAQVGESRQPVGGVVDLDAHEIVADGECREKAAGEDGRSKVASRTGLQDGARLDHELGEVIAARPREPICRPREVIENVVGAQIGDALLGSGRVDALEARRPPQPAQIS